MNALSLLATLSGALAQEPLQPVDQHRSEIFTAAEAVQSCLQGAWDSELRTAKEVTCTSADPAHPLTAQLHVDPMEGEDSLKSVTLFGKDRLWFTAQENDGVCDRTLLFLPGWGETTNSLTGDFLGSMWAGSKEASPNEALCVLGMNPAGKGTPGYIENAERLGAFGYQAMQKETLALLKEAQSEFPDFFEGKMDFIAHSLSGDYGRGVAFALAQQGKLDSVRWVSPVSSGPFAGVRIPFLWNIRGRVLPALGQTLSGKGAVHLTSEEWSEWMGGTEADRLAHVPSSPAEFYGWALNPSTPEPGLERELFEGEIPSQIILAEGEGLLPHAMSMKAVRGPYGRKARETGLSTVVTLADAVHMQTLEMTPALRNAWADVFANPL